MQGLNASTLRPQCPLWVKSGHVHRKKACPLCPRKRHRLGNKLWMSNRNLWLNAGSKGRSPPRSLEEQLLQTTCPPRPKIPIPSAFE